MKRVIRDKSLPIGVKISKSIQLGATQLEHKKVLKELRTKQQQEILSYQETIDAKQKKAEEILQLNKVEL
jgi:hypothetical protein